MIGLGMDIEGFTFCFFAKVLNSGKTEFTVFIERRISMPERSRNVVVV